MEGRVKEYCIEELSEQYTARFLAPLATIKGVMGIINEAAHFTMLQAVDEVKKKGLYKFATKKMFSQVFAAYEKYKAGLLYPREDENKFFLVEGLTNNAKRQFKSTMTDQQYFEMWIDCAASAHKGYSAMLEALRYKYEKALREYNAKDPHLYSWLVITSIVMDIAVKTYRDATKLAAIEIGVSESRADRSAHAFCIEKVSDAWAKAALSLFPGMQKFVDSTLDDRNILLGHVDLNDAIARQYKTMDCLKEAMIDNADLYANKKALIHDLENVGEYVEDMKDVKI